MEDKRSKNQTKYSLSGMQAMALVLEFGFIIVLPLITFGLLGNWLSGRYNNKIYLFVGLLLSLAISTVWLYKKIFQIYQELIDKE